MNYKDFEAMAIQYKLDIVDDHYAKLESILPVYNNISVEDIIKLARKVVDLSTKIIDDYPVIDDTEVNIASIVTEVSLFTGLTLEGINTFEAYDIAIKYHLAEYVESKVEVSKLFAPYVEDYKRFIKDQHSLEFIVNKHLNKIADRIEKTLDGIDSVVENTDFSSASYDKLMGGLKDIGTLMNKVDTVSQQLEAGKPTRATRAKKQK